MPIWAHTGHMFLKQSMSFACMQDYISGTCVLINPLHCILCGLVYIILNWTNGPWAQIKGPFYFEIVIYEMGINLFTNIEPMVDQKRVSTK